jgi:hypothetical protein
MSNQEQFDPNEFLEKRAANLAQLPAQQILARIGALLELLLMNQSNSSSDILQALQYGVQVTGTVDVGNTVDVSIQ